MLCALTQKLTGGGDVGRGGAAATSGSAGDGVNAPPVYPQEE
jgi:hypothetical protein